MNKKLLIFAIGFAVLATLFFAGSLVYKGLDTTQDALDEELQNDIDDMEGWQAYRSEEFEIEFRYPSDYYFEEFEQVSEPYLRGVRFSDEVYTDVLTDIPSNNHLILLYYAPGTFSHLDLDMGPTGIPEATKSDVMLGGKLAKKFDNDAYTVEVNERLYAFILVGDDTRIEQILESVMFINQ